MWLDEYKYYLDGPAGLSHATVCALLHRRGLAVLAVTLRPDHGTAYSAQRVAGSLIREGDPAGS